jgi:hypothetical protein
MKVNYVRRSSGKRTSITLPDYLCELWETTRPPVGEGTVKAGLIDMLQQLEDPAAGTTFQFVVEKTMVDDVRAYQNRLLATNDEMKCKVIDWVLESIPCQVSPDDKASTVIAAINQLKAVKWEFVEQFSSITDQQWRF